MKEAGENFLQGVVAHIDFLSYSPLAVFVDSHNCIEILTPHIRCIQKNYRSYKLKSNKLNALFKFYNADLERLIILLETGIECYAFPNHSQFRQLSSSLKNIAPFTNEGEGNRHDNAADYLGLPVGMVPTILWLETDERFPGRSRVCVAPREVFEFQLGGQDGDWERETERCANGVALVDIAEIRLGTIHTHTYPYILIYTHTYPYILIHTHTYSYTHIHTHTYSYILIHTHTCSYMLIHTHTYSYILVLTHTCSYILIHTHTYPYICS